MRRRMFPGRGARHRARHLRRERSARIFDEFQQIDDPKPRKTGRHRARPGDLAAHARDARRAHRPATPRWARARPSPVCRCRVRRAEAGRMSKTHPRRRGHARTTGRSRRPVDRCRLQGDRGRGRRERVPWRAERPARPDPDGRSTADIDGYEATRRIKADPDTRAHPDHRRDLLRPLGRRGQGRAKPVATATSPSPSARAQLLA